MRAVVQRVSSARVTVEGEVTGAIERGLLVYLGVGKGDGDAERAWMLDKILNLRIFPNEAGKMDKSVLDAGGALLVVSQFTLYADTSKGRRPSFLGAMQPSDATALYERFIAGCKNAGFVVETGRFGAMMDVDICNDGPVTIWFDTASPPTSAS